MTRTQRTWVVAAGVAAIVTAANASQGAYFSQSWGWVALAFLVPTTVLLILDRVAARELELDLRGIVRSRGRHAGRDQHHSCHSDGSEP